MAGNLVQNGIITLQIRTEQHAGSKIRPVPVLFHYGESPVIQHAGDKAQSNKGKERIKRIKKKKTSDIDNHNLTRDRKKGIPPSQIRSS